MNDNSDFLSTQLITYLGNKRALISNIETEVIKAKKTLGKEKCVCLDLFSGSGIVSRMLKEHSSLIYANDLEDYSNILNQCYLSNSTDFESIKEKYLKYRNEILDFVSSPEKMISGVISENYAPSETENVQKGERCFYTTENARIIDTIRTKIDEIIPDEDSGIKKYFLAPLLTEASVHTNTSGVFKGFYKNKDTGIGCFGGKKGDALSRIKGKVNLPLPVLSNFDCKSEIFQKDASELAKQLKNIDIAYLDPPYNQHPYGSNYFMLNLILKNALPPENEARLSKVSGIPSNWNRSNFNKSKKALLSMEEIISSLDARFILISYNSEGFITFDEMKTMCEKYGKVETIAIKYNTFRGSRNLSKRSIHVKEYIFVLEKSL